MIDYRSRPNLFGWSLNSVDSASLLVDAKRCLNAFLAGNFPQPKPCLATADCRTTVALFLLAKEQSRPNTLLGGLDNRPSQPVGRLIPFLRDDDSDDDHDNNHDNDDNRRAMIPNYCGIPRDFKQIKHTNKQRISWFGKYLRPWASQESFQLFKEGVYDTMP